MTKSAGATRQCAYCPAPGTTRDHVPPKLLFPHPRPDNLITVPSCEECRLSSQLDDEYFRQALLPREDVAEHPQAARIWPAEASAWRRPQKVESMRALFSRVENVEVATSSGIYLGTRATYPVEKFRLSRVASRITRGLFLKKTGHRLPDDWTALGFLENVCPELHPVPGDTEFDFKFAKYSAILSELSPTVIGDGVFSYRVHFFDTDPNATAWLLTFYDNVRFLVVTAPKSRFQDKWQKFTFPIPPPLPTTKDAAV